MDCAYLALSPQLGTDLLLLLTLLLQALLLHFQLFFLLLQKGHVFEELIPFFLSFFHFLLRNKQTEQRCS